MSKEFLLIVRANKPNPPVIGPDGYTALEEFGVSILELFLFKFSNKDPPPKKGLSYFAFFYKLDVGGVVDSFIRLFISLSFYASISSRSDERRIVDVSYY